MFFWQEFSPLYRFVEMALSIILDVMKWCQPDGLLNRWQLVWTVKSSVLPVLATEQPPRYITQSSCLVEHIIRLCHQLQKKCSTVVLSTLLPRSEAESVLIILWFFFLVVSSCGKMDLTRTITLTHTDCLPDRAVSEQLLLPCCWRSVLPVRALRALGPVGLQCQQSWNNCQCHAWKIQPLGCRWLTLSFYCHLCAPPPPISLNTTDLNLYVQVQFQDCKIVSNTSELKFNPEAAHLQNV